MKPETPEMSCKLVFLIRTLDEKIFGQNAATVEVIERKPSSKEVYVGYSPINDRYQVFQFIGKIVEEEVKTYRHFGFEEGDLEDWDSFSPFSIEEFLIFVAAHEVRHRVQYLLPIAMFSPNDGKKAKEHALRRIIRFVEICFEIDPPKVCNLQREFDARVIAWLATEIWHKALDKIKVFHSQIASLIKKDATILLKEEIGGNPLFLFLTIYRFC